MGSLHNLRPWIVAGLLIGAALPAQAGPLTVVEVGAPAINCVFNASCTITVNDSVGHPALALDSGSGFLQSRTYTGVAGTPGAGKTGYEYRLDLRQAIGNVDCIVGMVINFGPVTKLPYKGGQQADVFVITSGGLGTIGLKSAVQDGDIITFEFSKYVCTGHGANPGVTTFFFGLAAATVPKAVSAHLYGIGSPPFFELAARAPTH